MTRLLTFLARIPFKVKLYAVAALLALAGFVWFVHYERTLGAQKVLLAQSVEREKVAVKARLVSEHQADSLLKVQRHIDSASKASADSFTSASDARTTASANYHASIRTLVITDTIAVKNALRLAFVSDSTAKIEDAKAKKALADANAQVTSRDATILNLRAQLSARDSTEAALRDENKLLASEIPGKTSQLGGILKLAATAVVAFEAGKHL